MQERRVKKKLDFISQIITIVVFVGTIISASIIYANTQNTITNNITKNFDLIKIQEKTICDQAEAIKNIAVKTVNNEKSIAEIKNEQSATITNQQWIMNTLISINKKIESIEEALR